MINKILEIFFALFIITGLTVGGAYSIRLLSHLLFDKKEADEDEIDD